MKFNVNRSPFYTALQRIQSIVERRTNLPILTNALITAENNEIRISATDLEIAIQSHLPSNVIIPGAITVKAKNLIEIVRELSDGIITFEVDENQRVGILSGTSFFNLLSLPADDFPKIEGFEKEDKYEFYRINSIILAKALDKTLYATSTDTARYFLNGIFIKRAEKDEKLHFVATDGFRLAVIDLKELLFDKSGLKIFEKGVIVPRKGLYDLRRVLSETSEDLFMTIIGNMIYFKRSDFFISMRLIEGQFADYSRMIPTPIKDSFKIDKESFISAVKRAALVSMDKSKSVKLLLSNNLLCILAQSPELGNAKEEISIEYSGKEIEINFNSKFLIEALSSYDEKDFIVELRTGTSPVVFRSLGDENHISVIMPIKN